jgi:hypothetical protein
MRLKNSSVENLPYPYWDLADLDQIYQEFEQAMSGKKDYIELWVYSKKWREVFGSATAD